MRFREMLSTAGCRTCSRRLCSGSCSLHDVLSYSSRQIFSWRKGGISRVHQLNVPFGRSQQPSAVSPCITIVSTNQRKQRCKTKVYSFFCLLAWDLGNRGHQRKSEGSKSCRSRVGVLFRFMHLGTDRQNAKGQTRQDTKDYEAGADLLLDKN